LINKLGIDRERFSKGDLHLKASLLRSKLRKRKGIYKYDRDTVLLAHQHPKLLHNIVKKGYLNLTKE